MSRLSAAALFSVLVAVAQDSATLNAEGSRALANGDLHGALQRFQQAAKLDPLNLQIQFNVGLAFVRLGQTRVALPLLRKAASDPSLAPEAHYLSGAAYFESGEYASVPGELKDLRGSDHAEHVLYMLEESYRLSGHGSEARETFRDLNRRFPDSSWTHYLLGEAYENQSQNEKAIREYKTALENNPAQPNANFAIGYIYWRDQSYEAAKEWLHKEIDSGHCHSLASYYLGEISRNDQDLAGAETFFRRAIECDSRNVKAHIGLGVVLSELYRNVEAVRELQQAVRLDPGNTTPHYRLAVIYGKLGRKQEAAEEYAHVKQMQQAVH